MTYRVVRHPLVSRDLSTMAVFIGDYAGYDIAEQKIDQIEISLRSLCDFPHIGTIRNEIYPGLRVIPAAGNAVICFAVDEDEREVFVICITYGGADWEARVQDRR